MRRWSNENQNGGHDSFEHGALGVTEKEQHCWKVQKCKCSFDKRIYKHNIRSSLPLVRPRSTRFLKSTSIIRQRSTFLQRSWKKIGRQTAEDKSWLRYTRVFVWSLQRIYWQIPKNSYGFVHRSAFCLAARDGKNPHGWGAWRPIYIDPRGLSTSNTVAIGPIYHRYYICTPTHD